MNQYQQGIADFVNRMSAEYRKHSGEAVQEDMLMAVAFFDVPPSAFYEEPHEQGVLAAKAQVYRLTREVV